MPWRCLLSLAAVSSLGVLAGCGRSETHRPAAPLPAAEESHCLDGTWERVYVVVHGEKQESAEGQRLRLVIRGNTYTSERDGAVVARGRHKLDPAANPKAMDMIPTEGPEAGKCVRAVYEQDGDELWVCWTQTGEQRPPDLSSEPGSFRVLAVYRRIGS
jgi:uncharacterized protein (TIGR03067 family)